MALLPAKTNGKQREETHIKTISGDAVAIDSQAWLL
jgi:hypothetical protein